ncbi:MAG: hypothetical protein II124_06720 [Clostridia bacterium]|nr:hypothetical protein [Clostridia bacterium]
MKISKLGGYEPKYPQRPCGAGKKLAALTAAAVLAAGMAGCRSQKPALSGAPYVPDDTPICTEAAEPSTTGLINFDPEYSEEPALEGDVAVEPAEIDAPELVGLIMPDPGTIDGGE